MKEATIEVIFQCDKGFLKKDFDTIDMLVSKLASLTFQIEDVVEEYAKTIHPDKLIIRGEPFCQAGANPAGTGYKSTNRLTFKVRL